MNKRKMICVSTPTLGMVSERWSARIFNLAWPYNIVKSQIFATDLAGAEIAENRNLLVTKAMGFENDGLEVDSLFWVDDDVLISQGALIQLYNHQKPIVSGVYFSKGEPSQPLIFPSRLGGTSQFIPDQNIEIWGHGMGLALVKMEVYRRMEKEMRLPRDKYGNTEWYKTTIGQHRMEDGALDCGGTEDVYFLDNAGKLGYRPIIDCSKFAFGWHYDARVRRAYPEKQWNQIVNEKPVTWETPNGLVTWE